MGWQFDHNDIRHIVKEHVFVVQLWTRAVYSFVNITF